MIILKKLNWNNILSYQQPTSIQLDKEPLIQLVGDNGAGKTTIPLVIQEILYGKNIKNIKKQDLINRHSGKNGYSINLLFNDDSDEYEIDLDRKSTIKLQLFKNGKNISSHKSLDTYKQIADIIGISDFKTFSQLVYQSSTGSLEFLTATDTNRKRFLINLLQLEKYLKLHELFKNILRKKITECNTIEGKLELTTAQIHSHEKEDLTEKKAKPIPDSSKQEIILKKKSFLQNQLDRIKQTNQKIINNNQYLIDLRELNFDPTIEIVSANLEQLKEYEKQEMQMGLVINELNKQLMNLKTEESICPTCKQKMPATDSITVRFEILNKIEKAEKVKTAAIHERNIIIDIDTTYKNWGKKRREWERLITLIDNSLPSETLSKSQLEIDIHNLSIEYTANQLKIDAIIDYNQQVSAHNSKIALIKEQLTEYKANLVKLNKLYALLKEEADHIDVLKQIFSTNGLVSYKIEASAKELEKTINEYLAEFSYFQIYFILEKDKLNIQVIDEAGEETTVEGLSAGELGRVNIATVLAIRKIMASLASTEINFLFLDEIVGVLDTSGKEKLVEILMQERLNTYIVAHEFDHPLVPKLHIIKENNISRIENG